MIFAAGVFSCSDDIIDGPQADGEMKEYSGTITLDLSTPDLAERTRSLNTQPGANVMIGNLWIGVFDIKTGQCFGAKRNDSFNTSMTSGKVVKNLLNVDFVAKGTSVPLAYIVAVANYDNVTTWDGRRLTDILPDFDQRANITWDQLINLGIDTSSAYAGNKGENDNSNAPFMAGYFQDAVSLTQNPKIDQFAYDAGGPAAIYPESAASGIDIELGSPGSDQIFVAAGAICLRRLVSHNVIRFNTKNGYELTSVKYRRHNMPRSVFLLQRRVDTTRRSNFEEWQKYSANFADRLITEGNYDTDDPSFPYESDKAWIEVPAGSWSDASDIEIAFDHFENKHWGFGDIKTQDEREARNPDGTFKALCSGASDAYNNFASYFTLNLHIINKETGESADVEYTLHEGFCNTEDGQRAETLAEKAHDFSSFRNVNYNYNINISGISDITSSVTSDDDTHLNGQTGSIWKMIYADESGVKGIPVAGGDFNFSGKYMSFSDNPDLGFRIFGVDESRRPVDICYNMPQGMYEGFSGLWPEGNPTYVTTPDTGIPATLLQGMTIVSRSGATYTISDFIKGVNGRTIDSKGQYSLRLSSYDGKTLGFNENLKRGIYIFDRNDVRNATDADGCSRYSVAYGALQNSISNETIHFDINKSVVWDNTYYKSVSDGVATVYAAAQPIFYGAESSVIDMRWKHDSRFQGYEITVFNASFTSQTVTVGPSQLNKYLKQVKGETLFIYPFNTTSFPKRSSAGANNYSFRVVPIVDTNIYKVEGTFEVIHNQNNDDATCVRVCYPIYDLNSNGSNDWKTLFPISLKTIDAHYRGLHAYTSLEIGSQYNANTYWCYGGTGTPTNRYFEFVAATPGKFAVTCMNHSSAADPSRQIYIIRLDENGSQQYDGIKYDIVYQSNQMPYAKTTFTSPVLQLLNGEPTRFRIYAGGSIDYYTIQFIPN